MAKDYSKLKKEKNKTLTKKKRKTNQEAELS